MNCGAMAPRRQDCWRISGISGNLDWRRSRTWSGVRLGGVLTLLVICWSCFSGSLVDCRNVSFAIEESRFQNTDLVLLGDAFINSEGNLLLTKDSIISELHQSVGRALYGEPVRMFDRDSGKVASFHTSFEFRIINTSQGHGDGLAFVVVPDNGTLGSSGGWLGVLNGSSDGLASSKTLAVELDTFQNGAPIFDPDGNHIGIDLNKMKSVAVAGTQQLAGMSLLNGNSIKVWVDYNGVDKVLLVSINNAVPPVKPPSPILSYPLDVSLYLNEYMYVGFAASTGGWIEIHTVSSWSFSSSGLPPAPSAAPSAPPFPARPPPPPPAARVVCSPTCPPLSNWLPSPASAPAPAPFALGDSNAAAGEVSCKVFLCRRRFVVAFSSAFGAVLTTALGICFLILVRRRSKEEDNRAAGQNSDSEYVVGPRKFTYKELCIATKDFSPKKLLGSGGSGSVYMGILADCGTLVAVKRISAASRSGRREFTAELSIISRLRHRNLVPLRGWCSAKGQLLLVYDYMPNGSLDRLLFADLGSNYKHNNNQHSSSDSSNSSSKDVHQGLLWNWRRRETKKDLKRATISQPAVAQPAAHKLPEPPVEGAGEEEEEEEAGPSALPPPPPPPPPPRAVPPSVLTWERRYKIVSGVAAALCYLHDEWEMRVVHRDVKASNVMLDANYNARLGDFGLARASDHSRQPDTTVIVGTFGYLAPESTHTGKATEKTDVFSFGAVALEVACGRRPVERDYPVPEVVLVDWVWSLHKLGRVLDAADARLLGNYNPGEMACLLHIGLACSHPDPTRRPTMRQVVQILAGDAAVPSLPSSKPTPTYSAVLSPPVTIQEIIAQLDYMGSSSASPASPHQHQQRGGV